MSKKLTTDLGLNVPNQSSRHEPTTFFDSSKESVPQEPLSETEQWDEGGDLVSPSQLEDVNQEATEALKDPNLVEWDGPNDPENPMNFSRTKKWTMTLTTGLITFVVTFASSIFSTATVETARLFHVSTEVTTLGTSLFVAGFACGPLVWGPFSELFGRKPPMFVGFTIFCIFQIPVAVAQNLETIMLCRFFSGFFGSSPLAVVGGTLTDFWGPVDRGIAMSVFAGSTFAGPVMGPVIGGFVTESYLGWRWTAWITLIMGATFGIIGFIALPETYHPKLLQIRAAELRHRTKNWAYHSKADEELKNAKTMINTYLLRPIHMLIREPILLLITLYLTLVYGLLYIFFEAYPISFQEQRRWSPGIGSLPFLSLFVGILIGCLLLAILNKISFARKFAKHGGKLAPEERLPPMMIGAFILPIGLFWFGWTSSPHITWVPQVLAGIPIGTGILLIFLQGLNYIIDVYKWHANSAIAANTFVRATAAAGFPMFASAMFKKLGVAWAISLLGFLAVVLIPVPIAFYRYGKGIRELSRFSPK